MRKILALICTLCPSLALAQIANVHDGDVFAGTDRIGGRACNVRIVAVTDDSLTVDLVVARASGQISGSISMHQPQWAGANWREMAHDQFLARVETSANQVDTFAASFKETPSQQVHLSVRSSATRAVRAASIQRTKDVKPQLDSVDLIETFNCQNLRRG